MKMIWMNVYLILDYSLNMFDIIILFYELPDLLLQFHSLLGKKTPKLLESYGVEDKFLQEPLGHL